MFRVRPLAAVVMAVGLCAATIVASPVPAPARPLTPVTTAAPLPPPKAYVLVDADTGRIIDAGNDRTPMPPASLTKVITALAASNLAPDDPISVSDRAAAAPADKLLLKSGSVWTADEMVRALLLSSANDAAVALAERMGGTLEGFQPVFARTAAGLGMADDPVLVDPAGLDGPDGVEGGNLLSARDLAIAGRALLAVPTLADIVATPVYYFDGPDGVHHRLTNHNKLFLTTYAGAIGVKTGFTKRAGGCLMAAARVGGRTMLAVILNGANPTAQAKALLDKGFATPVEAESIADQLPAVDLGALRPPAAAPDTTVATADPRTQAPPTPGSALASSGSEASSADTSRWLVVGGATGAFLLGLGLIRGRRRRTRIFGRR
jgi:D-alanyl-D-alanine carboxypeptidase (penicillin-binding protein 5/6)